MNLGKATAVTILSVLFMALRVNGQQPAITVAELTLKIAGLSTEELYYGFAEGDQLIFSFKEINGKELKEIEVLEYPQTSKFADFKAVQVDRKTLPVQNQCVYKFRFFNSAIIGRVCKVKIERLPKDELTAKFNPAVTWATQQDTTWNSYTKDVVVGYDTVFKLRTQRQLIKVDTLITEVFTKVERVHSATKVGGSQYSNVDVQLPANVYYPLALIPYYSKEVVAWSYWIGVGQKAQEEYEKANNRYTDGITALGALTGYGALAMLAATGISMFGVPSVGEDVRYQFVTVINGEKIVFNSGKGPAAFGRHEQLLQGGFTIRLYNDNWMDGIDVTIKIVAVQLEKTWADVEYVDEKITPRIEKQIFSDPIITTRKVPMLRP